MELTFGYEQHEGFGDNPQHVWFAKNEQGAVHIWARLCTYPAGNYPPEWIGGIECHWAKCPDNTGWFNPDEPSQSECWLLKAPCWHDGSSLYFNESLARCLPVPWGDDPNSEVERATDYFNATMLRWHRDRIGEMRAETPLYASPQPCTDCAALRDEVERLQRACIKAAAPDFMTQAERDALHDFVQFLRSTEGDEARQILDCEPVGKSPKERFK